MIPEVSVIKYSRGSLIPGEEPVAPEELLEIRLHGEPYHHLLYLPGWEQELALGFLFTAGVINGLEDIAASECSPPGSAADQSWATVSVRLTDSSKARPAHPDLSLTLLQENAGGRNGDAVRLTPFPPPNRQLQIPPGRLLELMAALPTRQVIFHQTGATHAVGLATAAGEIMFSAEDVGRHNAFDKVIGRALLKQMPLNDKIALLSGRVSYEMVFKAARAGMPVIAAVSAATASAIRLADRAGITLAGFVRGARMNIYTHPERLTSRSEPVPT